MCAVALTAVAACGSDTGPTGAASTRTEWPHAEGACTLDLQIDGATPPVRVTLRRVGDGLPVATTSNIVLAEAPTGPGTPIALDAEGAATVEGLPTGIYRVIVSDGTGWLDGERIALQLPGERHVRRIEVPTPLGSRTISGRVLAGGQPVAGAYARVSVVAETSPWPTRSTITADDGSYSAPGLPEGEAFLNVTAPGQLVAHGLPAGVEIDVLEGAQPIRIDVVSATTGEPLVGARLSLVSGVTPRTETLLVTGADGHADAQALNDAVLVTVSAEGHIPGRRRAVPEDGLRVVLQPETPASVRVVDARTGQPVAGVVLLVHDEETMGRARALPGAVSGPDGVAHLHELSGGPFRVTAVGGGWVSAASPSTGLANDPGTLLAWADAEAETPDVPVIPAARVAGRVVDCDGRPIPGARIVGPMPWRSHGRAVRPHRWGGTATDSDGRFVLGDLVPGEVVRLSARLGEMLPTPGDPVTPSVDDPPDVDLVLRKGMYAHVAIAAPRGPSPRATLRVERLHHANWRGASAGSGRGSDPGVHRVGPLEPGRHRVRAQVGQHVNGEWVEFDVSSSAWKDVTVEVPSTHTLRGTVALPPGETTTQRTLWVRSTPPKALWVGATTPTVSSRGRLDEDGTFVAYDLPEGEYEVHVHVTTERARYEGRGTGHTGGSVHVELATIGIVAAPVLVEVVDADGHPVASASAALHGEGTFACEVSGGSLDVGRDAGAEYLELWNARDAGGRRIDGAARVVRIQQNGTMRPIQLARERTIAGTVRDADGAPVAGVRVTAQLLHSAIKHPSPTPGERGAMGHDVALTAQDGTYTLHGLGQLRYAVSVQRSRTHLASRKLGVDLKRAPAATTDVDLIVAPVDSE